LVRRIYKGGKLKMVVSLVKSQLIHNLYAIEKEFMQKYGLWNNKVLKLYLEELESKSYDELLKLWREKR
tara:strand:- start:1982 stop:2188 length:207 start_codon:yes stop_codon:yes gene_type:complete